MDITSMSQIIGSLGFPIVFSLIMFKYLEEEQKTHKEEMNTIKDAINNNTLTMQKLIDKLDSDKKGV